MIKMPKDVNKVLQSIEESGAEAYVAGGVVRDSLLGLEPKEWTILTTATEGQIPELSQADCELSLHRVEKIEEALRKAIFTVNAMADNPAKGFLDPFSGKKDLNDKLIRCIGDARKCFSEDPIRILKGIRLAAQLDFDIDMDTFGAMQSTVQKLSETSIHRIREEFEGILTAKAAARGLRISVAAGVMPYVLGEKCYPPKSKYETDQFNLLMERLDMVRQEIEYRFPMLFLCFDDKKAEAAIERLGFEEEIEKKYKSALKKTKELYFIVKPYDFKKFLYLHGKENYEYWENIVKQQRKVLDHPENRILSRYYMLKEFDQYKMAIYLEDLAVTEDDLRQIGIKEDRLFPMREKLLYMVHYYPRKNTKELLLKEAKGYNRNPFMKFFRDVHFMK